MACERSPLFWADRALMFILVAALFSCRGSGATVPGMGLSGSLPPLAPSPEPVRKASYANIAYASGDGIFDSSSDTLFAGSTLVLGSSATQVGWARYAFNLGGYQPSKLSVGLSGGGNGAGWVAIANFAAGRYDVFGPFVSDASINLGALPDHGFISSGGQTYVVVITSGGSSVSIKHVMLTYDNLADPTYSIAGTIYDEHGDPLPGITVETNPLFKSGVTDLNGKYLIGVPTPDDYTVTPQDPVGNHTFTPPSTTVTVDGLETGVNFTGSRVDITGHIEDGSGKAVRGVLLTLQPGGATTKTDANGDYLFPNVADDNYSVTPTLATYTFNPASKPANVAGADVENVDFTAIGGAPTYTVSGMVLAGGNPVPDVAITLEPGYLVSFTDSNGFYKFSGLADQTTYTLSPAKPGYTFAPPVKVVPVDGSSVPNQDLAATFHPTYKLEGYVLDSQFNDHMPGVEVTLYNADKSKALTTAVTDADGHYQFPALLDGDYVVHLEKDAYTWEPGNQDGTTTIAGADSLNGALFGHLEPGPTYNNSIAAMMSTYCLQCHRPDSDQAVDPPLRTYDEVMNAGSLCNTRIQNGTMPPYTTMPNYYKELFDAWRTASYPEN